MPSSETCSSAVPYASDSCVCRFDSSFDSSGLSAPPSVYSRYQLLLFSRLLLSVPFLKTS